MTPYITLALGLLVAIIILMVVAIWSFNRLNRWPSEEEPPTPREYQWADVVAEVEDIELVGYLEETASIAIIPPLTSDQQIEFRS